MYSLRVMCADGVERQKEIVAVAGLLLATKVEFPEQLFPPIDEEGFVPVDP